MDYSQAAGAASTPYRRLSNVLGSDQATWLILFVGNEAKNSGSFGRISAFSGAERALYALTDLTRVGSEEFVERAKEELGRRASGRKTREMEGQFELREAEATYNGHFEATKSDIRPENTYLW